MLNAEPAQAELKKLENKQWVEIRIASVARLPDASRGVARSLLGQDEPTALMDAVAQARFGQKIIGRSPAWMRVHGSSSSRRFSPVWRQLWNADGNRSTGFRINPAGHASDSARRSI